MSAETLARRFDAQLVVMVRRPISVVESHLSRGWDFDLRSFVDNYHGLGIFQEADLEMAASEADLGSVARVSHMWKLFSKWTQILRERHPGWLFVRHEDLLDEPIEGFDSIFKSLGIRFSDEQKRFLESTNRRSKDPKGREDTREVRRLIQDLKESQTSLGTDQCAEVSRICGTESMVWYPEPVGDELPG